MNFHTIDWTIIATFYAVMLVVAITTKKLNRSVADFLSANRCGGRYLLATAQGMAGLGAITIVGNFEKFYSAGFGAAWWTMMLSPIALIIALTGWILHRYRATRALTLAQFFEMRYSRRFRIFAGIMAWIAGVLNYGIFPVISARFIVYFMGFPETVQLLGFDVPTVAVAMAVMLGLAVTFTLAGGFITIMVTDFLQGQFVLVTFALLTAFLFWKFGWGTVVETLSAAPAGKSMINPFDQGDVSGFNFWFFAITAFKVFYNYMAWQGSQGYNSAARSPHEARMSRILGEWRSAIFYLITVFMPICAYVYLHAPQFAAGAAEAQQTIAAIADPQIAKQMTVPVAMTHVLPIGIMGMFAVVILSSALTTDDTYLHSWGSIFIQDVVQPLRKKPLEATQHIRWLRWSIFGVAAFAFTYGLIFPLKDYIYMYFAITGAIFTGGAGSVIVGGLYSRFGTTAGAWSSMIVGSVTAVTGIVLRTWWGAFPILQHLAPSMPLNGIQVFFIAAISSIVTYLVVSLLTCREPFDLDAMLHREPGQRLQKKTVLERLGIGKEFTRGDKLIYGLNLTWGLGFFTTFLVVTIIALSTPIPDSWWFGFWHFKIVLTIFASVVTLIWYSIGGFRNLYELYRDLLSLQRDASDDGTVRDPRPKN